MPRVILQAGHSDQFPPQVGPGGGAPGEAKWTAQAARAIAAQLQAAGVEVDVVGAWAVYAGGELVLRSTPPPVLRDADLFVSLHYLETVPGADQSACFAGRATLDPCGADADRFIAAWESIYPAATGITLDRSECGPNVTDYYGFRATTDHTPGVLIEHGRGAPNAGPDADTLWNRLDVVADADARAILAYLGLAPAPQPEPQPEAQPQPAQDAPEAPDAGDVTDDERAAIAKLRALGAGSASIDVWVSRLNRGAEIGRTIQGLKTLPKTARPLAAELTHLAD